MRLPFRRRDEPVTPDVVGHALRAPSRLHSFNRYEIKYLLPTEQVPVLRAELAARLDADSYSPAGGYGVWSPAGHPPRPAAGRDRPVTVLRAQRHDRLGLPVHPPQRVLQPVPGTSSTVGSSEFELVSLESIRGGALTELTYTVRLKKGTEPGTLIAALGEVTVLTGYDQADL
ncbi:hypothetical protein [Paractinoplanes toevensis]|uniref:Uncharacterized protein n=1 Tax=Paractinoplanes toevensis TaxID=571911 RepID=A0A919T916_9ACTN|nr:hypothetical protein [Actinoplanes toevensis]GIM90937.1 hypothetical protein Ato02nite_027300 [Actinoplanes toevensis]